MNAPASKNNVIRLPTAASEPVQQFPRRGRFPKSVGSFCKALSKKQMQEFEEYEKQRKIAKLDEEWWQALCYLQCREIELRALGAVPTRLSHKWS